MFTAFTMEAPAAGGTPVEVTAGVTIDQPSTTGTPPGQSAMAVMIYSAGDE